MITFGLRASTQNLGTATICASEMPGLVKASLARWSASRPAAMLILSVSASGAELETVTAPNLMFRMACDSRWAPLTSIVIPRLRAVSTT